MRRFWDKYGAIFFSVVFIAGFIFLCSLVPEPEKKNVTIIEVLKPDTTIVYHYKIQWNDGQTELISSPYEYKVGKILNLYMP